MIMCLQLAVRFVWGQTQPQQLVAAKWDVVWGAQVSGSKLSSAAGASRRAGAGRAGRAVLWCRAAGWPVTAPPVVTAGLPALCRRAGGDWWAGLLGFICTGALSEITFPSLFALTECRNAECFTRCGSLLIFVAGWSRAVLIIVEMMFPWTSAWLNRCRVVLPPYAWEAFLFLIKEPLKCIQKHNAALQLHRDVASCVLTFHFYVLLYAEGKYARDGGYQVVCLVLLISECMLLHLKRIGRRMPVLTWNENLVPLIFTGWRLS